MASLFLAPDEHTRFAALPATLQRGWHVQSETRTFQDTDARFTARMESMTLRSPKLKALRKAIQAATEDPANVVRLMTAVDPAEIDPKDMQELYFGVGPTVLSAFIGYELEHAATDDDMAYIALLADTRSTLLDALLPVFNA